MEIECIATAEEVQHECAPCMECRARPGSVCDHCPPCPWCQGRIAPQTLRSSTAVNEWASMAENIDPGTRP